MARPTALDADTHQIIIASLNGGSLLGDAAERASVTRRTLMRWLERGRHYRDALSTDSTTESDKPFYELLVNVERTTASVRIRMSARILAAADGTKDKPGDWRAAAWYLERSQPEVWGRRNVPEETIALEQAETVEMITADALVLIEQMRQQRIENRDKRTLLE